MDMLNCKPELHVVEQTRRDKYKVAHMNDFSNNTLDQQNIRNPNNFGLIGILQDQILVPGLIDPYQDCTSTFMNMPQSMHRVDPQGSSNWRRTDHTSLPSPVTGFDQAGIRPSNVGDMFSNHFNFRNHTLDCPLYTIDQSSMSTRSSCMEDNRQGRVTILGQTNHQNVVTVTCSGTDNEFSKSSYDQGSSSGSYRGEFLFLRSLGNQSAAHNASQWNHGSNFKEPLNISSTSHANKKGFSLSLSPEIPKLSKFRDDGNAAVSSTVNVYRHFGPLGPFTGYASILKSSRFLEPAKKMLEEFCITYSSKIIDRSESTSMYNDDSSGTFSSANHTVNGFSSSSEPKNRLKREKLLFMQEEVCKMYKLYNHQLQTIVSSFDSVAGLSAATPYISLALRRISRSFKALRTAIFEQLKQLSSQYSSSGDRLQKQQRSLIGNNVRFVESQHHNIWRPQRGLPECSVAVLRAWLFDHFLHPYPTDSDKQMLAIQTGLSRNQVSNWFINACVRLWKPMVEEMHMLDTKTIKNADTTSQACYFSKGAIKR